MNQKNNYKINVKSTTRSNFYGYVVNNQEAIKLGYKPPSMQSIIDTIIYNA